MKWAIGLTGFFTLLIAIAWTLSNSGNPAHPVADSSLDDSQAIYISDWANNRLVKIDDMSGTNWTSLSTTRTESLRQPVSIFVDSMKQITVCEQRHDRIVRFSDFQGRNTQVFQAKSGSGKKINKFMGSWICTDGQKRIYQSYDGFHRLIRINDMSGAGWVAFGVEGSGKGQFRYPAGIAVRSDGRIFISDFDNFRIVQIDDMTGSGWKELGHFGSGVGEFINPCGICLDSQGRIYIADQGNDRIVRVDDIQGTNWASIGSFGTEPEARKLYAPTGIALDRQGRIYVTESSSNHRIVRMDDMLGTNWTTFGKPGIGTGEFSSPMGIFVR